MRRLAAVALLAGLAAVLAAAAPPRPRATIAVRGLGWWNDHTMRGTLTLLLGSQRGRTIGASGIEDAALVLYSSLAQQGFSGAGIRVRVTVPGSAAVQTFDLDPTLQHPLPRRLEATSVLYEVTRGRRFKVGKVVFVGLTAMGPAEAEGYFRGQGLFAALTSERAYSVERLHRSENNLVAEMQRRGYAEAAVSASASVDPRTHLARIVVTVRQGPLWRVERLNFSMEGSGPSPPHLERKRYGQPWSTWWRNDAESDLRRWYYQRGYADVRIAISADAGPAAEGVRPVTALAHIVPGTLVRLGAVRFEGNSRTRTSVLRPLVKARPGQPLDPLQLQAAQYRISRLGVFGSVDLTYDPPQGPRRDAVFNLAEGKRQDVDLLLGWGTYDELRGGLEWRDYDLWGLAHEGTLKLLQSFKSSEGEYDYSIPEFLGTQTDLTDKLFGFRRIERAFIDQQYGNAISATTPLPGIGWQLMTGYTFERVHASSNNLATVLSETANANATSVQATLTRDRLDNPLRPRNGYKFSVMAEEASRFLGGQVDFQEFQFATAYHHPLGRSNWLHLGLSHEVITDFGAPPGQELPPNIFFYPGGEDSIRGYNLGQAAPRDPATGQYVPAQAATLLTVEFEQALTSKWSLVLFSDTLGATPDLSRYPVDYWLYSVGPGLSYQTIIGPIRLEYGRNLNPRPHDPVGTIQFSVGFPF